METQDNLDSDPDSYSNSISSIKKSFLQIFIFFKQYLGIKKIHTHIYFLPYLIKLTFAYSHQFQKSHPNQYPPHYLFNKQIDIKHYNFVGYHQIIKTLSCNQHPTINTQLPTIYKGVKCSPQLALLLLQSY